MRKTVKAASRATGPEILAWGNDPFASPDPSGEAFFGTPMVLPAPDPSAAPLPLSFPKAPSPRRYPPGTEGFRYWAAVAALRRGCTFWGGLLPRGAKWQSKVGPKLRVFLDEGDDLNAYYDRNALNFFHGSVRGRVVYSGESPDVSCHELGHAVLDSIKPQLFNAASIETAAFHESFGDISAILSALQLPSQREQVLTDTQANLSRSSRMSRLAEQLGWAIRQRNSAAVDSDCLRNAVNSFFYQDPAQLPPQAPAARLSSEPHSFSRVFTAGFLDALANMLAIKSHGTPDEGDLLEVSQEAGQLLIKAVKAAAIVPGFYSQVAAAMIAADRDNGKYRQAITSAFIRHGILSLQSARAMVAANIARPTGESAVTGGLKIAPAETAKETKNLPLLPLESADYALDDTMGALHVYAPAESPNYMAASAAVDIGSVAEPTPAEAAKSFVEDLVRLGRVDFSSNEKLAAKGLHPFDHPLARKTHVVVNTKQGFVLHRLRFDCGFDCGCGGM
jgi:hypothetical protein